MIFIKNQHRDNSHQSADFIINEIEETANELCEGALNAAKTRLHPLLHNVELDRLDRRCDFVQAFKSALEQRIAQQLASWQPDVQAVFEFEAPLSEKKECWDGSIHLLVMIPRPSNTLEALGRMLDRELVKRLKKLKWSRFRKCQSVVEVQHVTPNEVRHGASYGAMFYAFHTAPVKIWSQERLTTR